MPEYVCMNCGHIHRQIAPPENCLLCDSPLIMLWRQAPLERKPPQRETRLRLAVSE